MCGRFTLRARPSEVAQAFAVAEFDFVPRSNIAPTQDVLVIRQDQPHTLSTMRWGLVPSWSKQPKPLINARAETVAQSPAFRVSFRRRRCLIVADGFYEWQTIGKKKQPYHFHKPNNQVFAFAALWDTWNQRDACTIVTTDANPVVAPFHNRMPVILNDFETWLDPGASEDSLLELLRPYPEALEAIAASPDVNKATKENPKMIKPTDELFPQ